MNGEADATDVVLSASLTKGYPNPVGVVLSSFTLSCERGEIVALLGPSGCGKSTILNLLAGLVEPDDGVQVRFIGHSFGYSFQLPQVVQWRDCEANAFFEADLLGCPRELLKERVDSLLRVTGLDQYRTLRPQALSVGMLQRLQLVRVAGRPVDLYLLDEPLGAVDQPRRMLIAREIRELIKAGTSAAIWVTHDALEAVAVADRVLVLAGRPLRLLNEHRVSRGLPVWRQDRPMSAVADGHNRTLAGQAEQLRSQLASAVTASSDQYLGALSSGVVDETPVLVKKRHWATGRALLYYLVPALIALLLWEGGVRLQPQQAFYVSRPSEWLGVLFEGLVSGALVSHVWVTAREALVGLGIGMPLGAGLGFLLAVSDTASGVGRPYLAGLTAIPLFVLAPAFILWFGIGEVMKVAIAALSCFPFVALSVHDAAIESRGPFHRYLRLVGAKGSRILVHWTLPTALRGLLLSLRPAAVAALIGAFLGEFIAADRGLGYYIVRESSRYRVDDVVAGVAVLFALAAALDFITRRIASWHAWMLAKLRL